MRRAAYAGLIAGAALAALVAFLAGAALVWLCDAALRVHPAPRRCNCIVYALAQWRRRGGALYLRAARDLRVLGMPIPHLAWVERLGSDALVEQYTTDDPAPASGLSGIWFAGMVVRHETDPPVRSP